MGRSPGRKTETEVEAGRPESRLAPGALSAFWREHGPSFLGTGWHCVERGPPCGAGLLVRLAWQQGKRRPSPSTLSCSARPPVQPRASPPARGLVQVPLALPRECGPQGPWWVQGQVVASSPWGDQPRARVAREGGVPGSSRGEEQQKGLGSGVCAVRKGVGNHVGQRGQQGGASAGGRAAPSVATTVWNGM